ncbi:WASH complex subunit CCDC53-like protein [Leptotrombidium deliense]|uniref:WASH complex subunit CCDC53-like protein n=1 Tax=Leptotrombidium deliense TaxID=299467 RepID=A0A443SUB3_9ACAR|nr:WASH complex subunit CCDC53-like protein [Leptotrombidium deliense]
MSSIQQLQQSHVDLCKVSPIEKNRLIAFVNHFVVSVVKHLNYMTNLVDSRLNILNDKLNICHANLVILETKLNSVSGLAAASTPEKLQTETQLVSSHSEPTIENPPTKVEENERNDLKRENNEEVSTEVTVNDEEVRDETDEANNELLSKYYKMMRIGVPLGAVQQKMIAEGLDPTLLKV